MALSPFGRAFVVVGAVVLAVVAALSAASTPGALNATNGHSVVRAAAPPDADEIAPLYG